MNMKSIAKSVVNPRYMANTSKEPAVGHSHNPDHIPMSDEALMCTV